MVKKIKFSTSLLNSNYLFKKTKFLKEYKSQITKVLFSSVVPKVFNIVKKYFIKSLNQPCIELKSCNLHNLIKIKVNKKQIGSDRLANAISAIDKKIILLL